MGCLQSNFKKRIALAAICFFGPGILTCMSIIVSIAIASNEIKGFSSIFTVMLDFVTATCILLMVYTFFVLICGSQKTLVDMSMLLLIFCFLMLSFPIVFWILKKDYTKMIRDIWVNKKNSNIQVKFQKMKKCQNDCEEKFVNIVVSISNFIAYFLFFLSIIVLAGDILFFTWQYKVHAIEFYSLDNPERTLISDSIQQ